MNWSKYVAKWNVIVKFAKVDVLPILTPAAVRDAILIMYAQAYTPLTKPMDGKPFADHPFLLSHLLGSNSHSSFHHIRDSMEGRRDYRALCEAIILMLHRAQARIEFVMTSRYIDDVLSVDLSRPEIVRNKDLLVQVCLPFCCVPWYKIEQYYSFVPV